MARAPKADIKPGDVLGGKYRIEQIIGQGGMGVVAAARHTELHQRVAIKVLPVHLASDKDLVERFMREARAAARLRSDHAVKVVDVGERSNGSPYIVMELLEGEDLGAVLSRGPLPIADSVDFILQACEAVAEAHALGIVHRDLKPRNLFLTAKLHGKPLVKVLDFGLAKRVDMQDRKLTATAAVMGSPHYMSPEQMRALRNIDFRTDVWSLGVCLYELVSARVPFDAGVVPVLCAMVLKDDPAPLPAYRPDVPPGLWAVIQKCLMKNPADRYATISDLAAALEPFAPAHAAGSAQRISQVLFAVPLHVSDHPPGLESGPHHEPDGRDTRTAATFDSASTRERGNGSITGLVIGAIALFSVVIAGATLLVVFALRPPTPTSTSTPTKLPREREVVFAMPAPPAIHEKGRPGTKSEAAPTFVPAGPTGPALGGQGKGPGPGPGTGPKGGNVPKDPASFL